MSFLSFSKFHTEDCSVAPESVLPLFSLWLTRSSSAVSQVEHLQKGNAEGTRLPAHYTLLSIEQKRTHSHNIFCITGNFLKFPVINLPNSIFCGLIHLASQQRFQQIWQLPAMLFSHDFLLQPHIQCASSLSPSWFWFFFPPQNPRESVSLFSKCLQKLFSMEKHRFKKSCVVGFFFS